MILEWFELVDQTVDALMRCHLYEVQDDLTFKYKEYLHFLIFIRNFYFNISSNWGKGKSHSWKNWMQGNLKSSFGFVKNIFRNPSKPEEKGSVHIDLKDLQNIVYKYSII